VEKFINRRGTKKIKINEAMKSQIGNGNDLFVEDLKSNTDYKIDWYDKNDNLIQEDCQNTNNKKLKLKFPKLTVVPNS
jgi:hypothetical protein